MSGPFSLPRIGREWIGPAAGIALLTAASWLYIGYEYGVGNQLSMLAQVLGMSGELQGDWLATSVPPPHWAADHVLALAPESARHETFFVVWLASLVVLWAGFIAICHSLGAPWYVGCAAGLLLVPDRGEGFGGTSLYSDSLYPTMPSWSLVVASLALLLRERRASAGAVLGLSVLAHPGVGTLAVGAFAPVALRNEGRLDLRAAARFGLPLAILALPALVHLISEQVSAGSVSPREQYEFLALVRAPHHFLYRDFSPVEYLQTGLWLAGLAASCALLWRLRAAREAALVAATIVVICAAGAVASEVGQPVALAVAETSRLSTLLVVLGTAATAAALNRLLGPAATVVALVAAFLTSPWIEGRFEAAAPEWASIGGVEASLLLVALGTSLLLTRVAPSLGPSLRRFTARPAAIALIALAFGVSAVSLIVEQGSRSRVLDDQDLAVRDVAEAAARSTEPTELVLVSPGLTGTTVRAYSKRPIVVDFKTTVAGEGLAEFKRRLLDLTNDPRILDPDSVGTSASARYDLIEAGYQRTVGSSVEPICRYRAAVVIARPLLSPPPWLRRIYSNDFFHLYRVRPEACTGVQLDA